jgi:DNA-dependent RNA polymerase auxiliary subunit epsilon
VHTPQEGKPITTLYLTAAFEVLAGDQFSYVREVIAENDAVLEFVTEIDGVHINGVDLIRWNDAGKIVDFKVMVRPLKAVTMLQEKMFAMLQKMQS